MHCTGVYNHLKEKRKEKGQKEKKKEKAPPKKKIYPAVVHTAICSIQAALDCKWFRLY